jgi:hypothetical protein
LMRMITCSLGYTSSTSASREWQASDSPLVVACVYGVFVEHVIGHQEAGIVIVADPTARTLILAVAFGRVRETVYQTSDRG